MRQLSSIVVTIPPSLVPGLIVTFSLNILLLPIINLECSPLNFLSCGTSPIEEKGKNLLFFPIFVFPEMLT